MAVGSDVTFYLKYLQLFPIEMNFYNKYQSYPP